MCGRFVLRASPEAMMTLFDLAEAPLLAPRYNIAPTQPVAIVRVDPDRSLMVPQREWTHVVWGLIPGWAKDPSIGARMINARSETAAEKPSFRAAMKYRRCLVPTDGFYEWMKVPGGKQPMFIHRPDHAPFAIAGLWERWTSPDGSLIESCTLLTTEPNAMMAGIHNRMPVILDPADYEMWLDAGHVKPDAAQHLLRPCPDDWLTAYPVSTVVNNARNEVAACVEPLPA